MTPPRKKSAKSACGLTGAEAQAAYEKLLAAGSAPAPGAKDLADHVAGCAPCSSALHTLELQGDAVSALSKQARGGAAGTTIEGILRIAAHSGTGKLADLAYELAKACLIRLPNLERRVRRVVEPREAKLVARELRAVNQRRGLVASPVGLTGVPEAAPAEADALRAATSCLKILEKVEGASPRQVLGMAQVHIFEKRPERAEALLRGLLAKPLSPAMSSYARINLMLSLSYQKKYPDVVTIGRAALRDDGGNWEVLFNLAVAHACLKNAREFAAVSKRLAQLVSHSPSGSLHDLLTYETPRIAAALSEDPNQVARRFGILPARRSRRNAS